MSKNSAGFEVVSKKAAKRAQKEAEQAALSGYVNVTAEDLKPAVDGDYVVVESQKASSSKGDSATKKPESSATPISYAQVAGGKQSQMKNSEDISPRYCKNYL